MATEGRTAVRMGVQTVEADVGEVDSGGGSPRRYRWVTWAVPALLVFYFFGGLATKRTGEIFPVFHWALFASVAETKVVYELYVSEMDGRRYEEPVLLQETDAYRERLAASYDLYNTPGVIGHFARAYEAGRSARAEQLKEVLERNFLPGEALRYEVRKVTYNPLERFRTGEIRSVSTVGAFSKETYASTSGR